MPLLEFEYVAANVSVRRTPLQTSVCPVTKTDPDWVCRSDAVFRLERPDAEERLQFADRRDDDLVAVSASFARYADRRAAIVWQIVLFKRLERDL